MKKILNEYEVNKTKLHIQTEVPIITTTTITPSADFSRKSWLRLLMYRVPA